MLTHDYICYQQVTFVNISICIIRRIDKYPETFKLTVVDLWIWILQNSNFHLRIQILWRTTNTIGCFPWSDRLILLIFKKISARYCLNSRICLLYVLASKKWYSKKKAANLADSSNNCNNNAFHGINWHVLVCSWSALFVPPVSLNHLYSEVKI